MPATNTDPQSVATDTLSDINKAVARLRRLVKAGATPEYVREDATAALDKIMSAMVDVLAIVTDSHHPEPVISSGKDAATNGVKTPAKA